MSSVCSVDKKNFCATLHHSHISTQQNSVQGNCFIHLTAKFTHQPTNYRSLLVDFSLVPRSSLVVLSFVIRYPIEDITNTERENSEKTTKWRREADENQSKRRREANKTNYRPQPPTIIPVFGHLHGACCKSTHQVAHHKLKTKTNDRNGLFLTTQNPKLLAREPINIWRSPLLPTTYYHPLNQNTAWSFSPVS